VTGDGHDRPLPAALADRLGFMLIRASARAGRLAADSLEAVGIDARDYGVLALIAELGPLSQQNLAQLLHVDRSTMVALVDELESRGLVRRRRNPSDRRAYAIEATSDGLRAQERAAGLLAECERHFLDPLSSEDQRAFRALLRRVASPDDPEGSGR